MFVDPRTARPPAAQRALTDESDEIKPLARLCREGRLYAVEEWISAGKPLWTTRPPVGKGRVENLLRITIDTNQYDLALLLLCNGFPPDADVLTHALYKKAPTFVDLLLTWGADPLDADAYAVLDTYDAELYDRFWAAGLDFTCNHILARMLADQSSNRPAGTRTRSYRRSGGRPAENVRWQKGTAGMQSTEGDERESRLHLSRESAVAD